LSFENAPTISYKKGEMDVYLGGDVFLMTPMLRWMCIWVVICVSNDPNVKMDVYLGGDMFLMTPM
jgi:hypothetical protein